MVEDRAWVEIDLGAIAANFREIRRQLADHTQTIAVVKADAYGHGAGKIARTLVSAGVDWLAVATVKEGIELRQADIITPILVLGAVGTESIPDLFTWQLSPTIVDIPQALSLAAAIPPSAEPLPIHLKIDTGMSRLGTNWQEAVEFASKVATLAQFEIASIYSHFATADEPENPFAERQHDRFRQAITSIRTSGIAIPAVHLANSAGLLRNKDYHYDLVRPGLILYGYYPHPDFRRTIVLTPAMQVKARLTQLKTIPPGTGVSYGHRWIAQRLTRLGIVEIGYADGVPRQLSDRLQVIVRGCLIPQIGTITMDRIVIDTTDLKVVAVGDIVTLIGKDGDCQIDANDWARKIGTISWEILCGFKHRLPRIYKD